MRLWKHLMKGDSQERKPNHILAYFICYVSTESSELVWPFASTPLLHQQEAAVAGMKGQFPLEQMYLSTSEPWLALPLLISPCHLIAWCSHTYKQGNCDNNQKKKQVKTFLVLAQFLLNQLAGNKAGFCSLLKGAEQHKESSHLLLAFCGNASVPVSPSFSDTERQLTRQLELCSLRLHVQRESLQFLLNKHIINDTVLPACTDKRLYPINFKQLRFLAKNIR